MPRGADGGFMSNETRMQNLVHDFEMTVDWGLATDEQLTRLGKYIRAEVKWRKIVQADLDAEFLRRRKARRGLTSP